MCTHSLFELLIMKFTVGLLTSSWTASLVNCGLSLDTNPFLECNLWTHPLQYSFPTVLKKTFTESYFSPFFLLKKATKINCWLSMPAGTRLVCYHQCFKCIDLVPMTIILWQQLFQELIQTAKYLNIRFSRSCYDHHWHCGPLLWKNVVQVVWYVSVLLDQYFSDGKSCANPDLPCTNLRFWHCATNPRYYATWNEHNPWIVLWNPTSQFPPKQLWVSLCMFFHWKWKDLFRLYASKMSSWMFSHFSHCFKNSRHQNLMLISHHLQTPPEFWLFEIQGCCAKRAFKVWAGSRTIEEMGGGEFVVDSDINCHFVL